MMMIMIYGFALAHVIMFMTVQSLKMRLNESWNTLELVSYLWQMLAQTPTAVSSLLLWHHVPLSMVIFCFLLFWI